MKSIYYMQEKMEENDKVISEIKTEFQGAQGKNRLKFNFTKGIEEMLGNNQEHDNKIKK